MILPLFVFPFHFIGAGRNIPDVLRAEKLFAFLFDDKREMNFFHLRPIVTAAGLPKIRGELLLFVG